MTAAFARYGGTVPPVCLHNGTDFGHVTVQAEHSAVVQCLAREASNPCVGEPFCVDWQVAPMYTQPRYHRN